MRRSLSACAVASAVIATAFVAPTASAGMVAVSSLAVWEYYVGAAGLTVGTETFGGLADGSAASQFTGSVAGIDWTAASTAGVRADGGVVRAAAPVALTFTFSPGVYAVAGNFFGVNSAGAAVPVLFAATLSDGTAYSGMAPNASSFAGFVSSDPSQSITSLRITVINLAGSGSVAPAADNLLFGVVPAPGAVALLVAAGLVGSRRPR